MICIHCKRDMDLRAKGLCQTCWRHHGHMYPKSPWRRRDRTADEDDEPETMAEVEAIIEEQMRCLPDWWTPIGKMDSEN